MRMNKILEDTFIKKIEVGLIPKFRFPEFLEKGEWEKRILYNISEVIMGASPSSSSYNETKIGLPLLQGNTDIKNRLSSPRVYTSEITKKCMVDDILLSVRAPVGTVAKSLHNACIGRGLAAIRTINKNSQEYLYQWLLSYESSWRNISQGGTFDAVNSDDIKNLLLPIPQPEEQQKIAACLSSLDDVITAETQKLETLQAHKKGLLQNLFPAEGETVPRLRFKEFEDSGEWKEKRLEDIAEFLKGKGISKADIGTGGIQPCIRYGELYTSYGEVIKKIQSFTNLPADELILSEENDVIIPSSGETKEDIATASCVKLKGVALGGDLNILRSKLNGEFLAYYLSHGLKKSISKIAQGDAVVHLYSTQLKKLSIRFPSRKEEQVRIAISISSLDELIAIQNQRMESLNLHKKGLIQGLFPNTT